MIFDNVVFDIENINPIFNPLIYDIESLKGDLFSDFQLFKSLNIDVDLRDENKNYTYDVIKNFNSEYLTFCQNNREVLLNPRFKQLIDFLNNPFHYYLESISVNEIDKLETVREAYPEFFEEIARDNVITQIEESFLIEKLEEKDIDVNEFIWLQNNDIIGLGSFKVLVDQVCEDGILTDNERLFITEKAKDYNVPDEILHRLIDHGLTKAKIVHDNLNDEIFYEYVIGCLIHKFLTNMGDIPFVRNVIKQGEISDEINEVLKNMLSEIIKSKLLIDIPINSTVVLLRNLGIKIPTIKKAIEIYKKKLKANITEIIDQGGDDCSYRGYIYRFYYEGYSEHELFHHKIHGNRISVIINKRHPLINNNPKEIKVLNHLIISLIATKLEYPNNRYINHFWKLFNFYQQHLTIENYD